MAGGPPALADVLAGIRRSAPVYACRLDHANLILGRHRQLRNEAARLSDSLASKSHFSASYRRQIEDFTRSMHDAQADFDAAAAAFRESVLRHSAISYRHGDDPHIFWFCGLSCGTPHSVRARHRARSIDVRARILRKTEHLLRLRKCVFCSDDDDADLSLGERIAIEHSPDDFIDELARNIGEEAIVVPPVVSRRLAELVQAEMSCGFDGPRIDFFRLTFARPREFRQDFGRIFGHSSTPRASPAIDALWQEIREINGRIPHLQPFGDVIVSADTIVEASRRLQLAQKTMNHIDFARRSESPELATHFTRVTCLMSDLVSLLKQLPQFQAEALRPITVPTQLSLSIDVVSRAQIERVFGLIRELEQTLSQTLELQSSHLDGLADHLSFIRGPAESDAVAAAQSDELARLQDAQLRTMQSIIESLPDAIEISHDLQLASFEMPVLTLPTAAPKVFATSDPICESNLHLIEQIEKRKFDLEEVQVQASEGRLVTDGSQKVLDDLTKAIEVPDIDVAEMEAKREELLARLAEAQRKLDARAPAAPEKRMEELRDRLQQREMEVEKREAQLVELGKIRAKVMPLLNKTRASLARWEHEYKSMKQKQARLQRIQDDMRSVKTEQDELAELTGLKDQQAIEKFSGE